MRKRGEGNGERETRRGKWGEGNRETETGERVKEKWVNWESGKWGKR